MSRAHGRHTGRPPVLTPEQDEEYGIEAGRDIPGGDTHLMNKQVIQQQVPAAEPLAPFRGMMSHGVAPARGMTDRDHPAGQGRPRPPHYAKEPARPSPVPVYIVEEGAGGQSLRMTVTKHFQAPPIGAEPVSICGQDEHRHALYLLNEGFASAKGVRVGTLSDLAYDGANNVLAGGAMLPNAMTSYQKLEGQSPLYVVSMDANTPVISVIIETSTPGAA